jgi:hypothetical protein
MNRIRHSSNFVLGALLLSSLSLSYATPTPISMDNNDLQRIRHGELIVTPVITKDKRATGTFGNAPTTLPLVFAHSYYTQTSTSANSTVQYDINDPTQFILPLLVKTLQKRDSSIQWRPTQVIHQFQAGIDQFEYEIGDRTALTLISNGWHLRRASFSQYVLSVNVTAKLVSGQTHQTIWQASCDYQDDASNAHSYREYEVNNGVLIKLAITQGARYCANQLALNFENK